MLKHIINSFVVLFFTALASVVYADDLDDFSEKIFDFIANEQSIVRYCVQIQEIASKKEGSTISEVTERTSYLAIDKEKKFIRFDLWDTVDGVDQTESFNGCYRYLRRDKEYWFGQRPGDGYVVDKLKDDPAPKLFNRPDNPFCSTLSPRIQGMPFPLWDKQIFTTEHLFIPDELAFAKKEKGLIRGVFRAKNCIIEISFKDSPEFSSSVVSTFPKHDKINLESPGKGTRKFHEVRAAWKKMGKSYVPIDVVSTSYSGPSDKRTDTSCQLLLTWLDSPVPDSIFTPDDLKRPVGKHSELQQLFHKK